MNVIKSYARRDSATALLRKMGVAQIDYALFITLVGGEYRVDVTAAEEHVGDDDELVPCVTTAPVETPVVHAIPEPEVMVIPKPVAKVVEPKATKKVVKVQEPKVAEPTKVTEDMTVSDVARTLILEGKTNKEVWAVIQAQFGLDDSKKSYPSWYRCELKRKGQL